MSSALKLLSCRVRAAWRAHPEAWAALLFLVLGVIFTAIDLIGIWSSFAPFRLGADERWWHLALIVPACAALLLKRRKPVVALVIVTTLFLVDLVCGGNLAMLLIFWEAIYAAAANAGVRARQWIVRSIAAATVVVTVATALLSRELQPTVFAALQSFAILATPYWWATSVRQQRDLAEAASRRAAELQEIAELRESQILREERSKMARDLHDVIAGQLSAIAIHSEAALAHSPTAERDRTALTSIRGMSVRSLSEMRSMIVLLRGGHDAAATVGGLERLGEMVSLARETGLEVTVDINDGEQQLELPAVVDQALARILQESLTNASKHGPNGRAHIAIEHGPASIRLTVESESESESESAATVAPSRPAGDDGDGGGMGLLTMTERAIALGGSLEAGWSASNAARWRVRAEIPLSGSNARRVLA